MDKLRHFAGIDLPTIPVVTFDQEVRLTKVPVGVG